MTQPENDQALVVTYTVVCARADHPRGYGNERTGEAHGYVLLFVTGVRPSDVPEVCKWMSMNVVQRPFEPSWCHWYGGRFDPVALLEGEPIDALWPSGDTRLRSIGDNRAYATVRWDELRAPESTSSYQGEQR